LLGRFSEYEDVRLRFDMRRVVLEVRQLRARSARECAATGGRAEAAEIFRSGEITAEDLDLPVPQVGADGVAESAIRNPASCSQLSERTSDQGGRRSTPVQQLSAARPPTGS
jgi:hypothetical protein